MKKWALAALGVAILMIVSPADRVTGAAPARTSGQAAVVVQFGPGQTVVRVVDLPAEPISGEELLTRSGLAVIGGGGMTCKIGPLGCDYPGEPCFCHCTGSGPECAYWNYLHLTNGQWRYSSTGASAYVVTPGAIDGFAWGSGVTPPATDPVAIFDASRLAPGLAEEVVQQGGVAITFDFQGDVNQNASAVARYRRAGSAWSAPQALMRAGGRFAGTVELRNAGSYELRVECSDPDGVNGSSSWAFTTVVTGTSDLYLPILVNPTGVNGRP